MRSLHLEREVRQDGLKSAEGHLHKTQIDLAPDLRGKMVELCNARLADCTDLTAQVKTAHWNVKGSDFIGLHKLFDEIYEEVSENTDTIAERCVQLGGTAMGTVRIAARQSQLEEYPTDIFACEDHVRELSRRLAAFGKLIRESAEQSDSAGDMCTSDVFVEIGRSIDKWLWFVEAHQQV